MRPERLQPARGDSPCGWHDAAYEHHDYDYLQRHLARNGFISASIDVLADSTGADDQQQAADEAWAFVESFLWSAWSKSVYINPQSVALIGHSRGGGTVRYLADKLKDDPVFQVRSVISLAPVGADDQFIDGTRTVGYLTLYGTTDHDVSPRGVYRHYDRAGTDDSQFDPAWRPDVVYKAMKLIHGAAHTGYSDLGSVAQQNLVKGFVLAFLKAHNADDVAWYEDYIRGDAVPGGWTEPVLTQYSDGFYRRVIDHFDDGTVADNTAGGTVSTDAVEAHVLDLDLALYGSTYVHETRVLWMWGTAEGAAVTWSIPAGSRNASAFKWLSLRLGQAGSTPSEDLRIQIRNGLVWSRELRLADYGVIAQPTSMCFAQLGDPCRSSVTWQPFGCRFRPSAATRTCVTCRFGSGAIRSRRPSSSTTSNSPSSSSSPERILELSWSRLRIHVT